MTPAAYLYMLPTMNVSTSPTAFQFFLFYMNWCSEDNNNLIYALFIGG